MAGPEVRLTKAQRRHLTELVEIAEASHGEAGWRPDGAGEWRCALALESKGLLDRDFSMMGRGAAFTLVDAVMARRILDA